MRHGRRWAGSAAAALLTVTSLIVAAPNAAATADAPALTAAVTAKLLGSAQAHTAVDERDTRITVSRTSGRWAFGTAVALAPRQEDAHPTGSIFIARADPAGWRVAIDGEAAFGDLAAESPW